VTAIIGVPIIIAGVRLKDASDMFKRYVTNHEFSALGVALEKQGRFYFIIKVLVIIYLVMTLLGVLAMIILLIAGVIPPFKDHAF
jgi:ABC-type multidrug transport system permease subunit